MFKKIMVLLVLGAVCFSSYLSAGNSSQKISVNCSPQIKKYIQTMEQLPEIKELISSVQKEGHVSIIVNSHPLSAQFGAYWDAETRQICINLSSHRSEGEVIGSILFELHNALMNSKLEYLDSLAETGRIDKESYVEAIEKIEYYNSKNAAAIAQKGIDRGFFPPTARLNTYRNFEEHYRMQKIGGHSIWIARNYDLLAPSPRTTRM